MSNAEPDYLVCQECETPCYTFDWDSRRGQVFSAFCEMCGNDSPEAFSFSRQESGAGAR
jgi:hypothetical protein